MPVVSVIFPCLNEEVAIGGCVRAARQALADAGLDGEVLVVDNGSTDRSAALAREAGARVVAESRRGYGSAYLRGIAEARGEVLVMLDADGTYPVERLAEFVTPLREGRADMVLGNRFAAPLAREAMPWANRYIGNPILSGMTRLLFRVPLRDMHCGMRSILRSRAAELVLQAPGMEFATEMIVKALDRELRVEEIAIEYRERIGRSKLHPLRDAWRHVEFMLVFSPALLFLWPGCVLLLAGLAVQAMIYSGPTVLLGRPWDVHTSLAGLVAALTGATLAGLGAVSTTYASGLGMRFRRSALARAVARGADRPWRVAGLLALFGGVGLWAAVLWRWTASGFGALAALHELSLASSLVAVGVELLGTSFVVQLLALRGTSGPIGRSPAEPE